MLWRSGIRRCIRVELGHLLVDLSKVEVLGVARRAAETLGG